MKAGGEAADAVAEVVDARNLSTHLVRRVRNLNLDDVFVAHVVGDLELHHLINLLEGCRRVRPSNS